MLLACQGFVGAAQYAMEVPAAMVWIHVVLAGLTWLSLLWAAASAGTGAVQPAPAPQGPGARVRVAGRVDSRPIA